MVRRTSFYSGQRYMVICMTAKMCPLMRVACDSSCEFWCEQYNWCDIHRFMKHVIEEM